MAPHLIKTYDRHVDMGDVMAQIEVPRHLMASLEANPRLMQKFGPVLANAVAESLQDPETSPAILSQAEVKRRVQLANEALIFCHCEEHMSLTRSLDLLPNMLKQCLILEAGGNPAELTAIDGYEATKGIEGGMDGRWGVDVVERVNPADLPSEEDEEAAMQDDLNAELDQEEGPVGIDPEDVLE